MVSIPQSMGMGVVAFAPLGLDYASVGLVAGLLGGVVVTAFSALFGGTPGLISGPRGSVSLVFAAILAQFLAADALFVPGADKAAIALSFGMFALMIAGVLQIVFGLTRLGDAIKFVPYPVIAGFLNAAAVLIVLGQLRVVFELPAGVPLIDFWRYVDDRTFVRIGIVIVTIAAVYAVPKLVPRVPGLLLGALFGVGVYYVVYAAGLPLDLEATLPGVDRIAVSAKPVTDLAGLLAAGWGGAESFAGVRLSFETWAILAAILLPGAVSISLLQAFDSLFSSVALDDLSRSRSNGRRELVAQGAGTLAGAAFGLLGGSGSMARTKPSFDAGGRSGWAGLASSLYILVGVMLAAPFIARIPEILVAAVLFVIAIELFDKWTVALLKSLRTKGFAARRAVIVDLAIVALVVATSVCFGLIEAVGVGMAVAIVAFVFSVGRSPVRRAYRGNAVSTFLQRGDFSAALLREHGSRIAVLELEGPFFFGSAGKVEREVERLAGLGVRHVILDLKRVSSIDSTASQMLSRMARRQEKYGRTLAVSYLMPDNLSRQDLAGDDGFRRAPSSMHENWLKLEQFGAIDAIGRHRVFADTDTALRDVEMLLIEDIVVDGDAPAGAGASMAGLLDELTDAEMAVVRSYAEECRFTGGSTIFEQGDVGDSLYILLDGMVDAVIADTATGRRIRVNTMTRGAVFGEMAILDPQPRSATLVAMEDAVCYRISAGQFERLNAQDPSFGLRLMKYMCLLFTTRLRLANLAIIELES
jgi:SulP family sulfate permease